MAKQDIKKRITLDLAEEMLSAVDETASLVRESRNQFIVDSVRERIRALRRKAVDDAFAAMAEDRDHQAELMLIEREMSGASDAAWRRSEAAATQGAKRRGKRPQGRNVAAR